MLKVVLIDDERIVLKGIAAAIRRESDYELAGIAENGLDGLELIRRERPEIVLTDIRMPGKTGLEMIRESKQFLPDTIYIVFSGFNEFKYVKEAIGLGVIDYLEKPVTMPKLRETLKKAADLYRYKERYAAMADDLKKADHAFVETCLRQLFEHPDEEEGILSRLLEKVPALERAYSFGALMISGKQTQTIEGVRPLIGSLTFSPTDTRMEVYSFYGRNRLMLVYFNMGHMEFPYVQRLSRQLQAFSKEGMPVFAGISRIHRDIYGLSGAFDEAGRAHRYAAYLEAEELVCFDDVEYTTEVPQQPGQDHESLEFSFRMGEYAQCRAQIQAYLRYLLSLDLLPDILIQKCLELIIHVQRLLRDAGLYTEEESGVEYAQIRDQVSGESIVSWTRSCTDRLLETAEERADSGTGRAVRLVKQYVEKHYADGISLDVLAQEVGMSSTYLSMLFKKEEGTTYIRYLTNVRMEKAMEYLRQGHKAKNVCEMVGYHDYKYFSSQFKAATGMTLENFKKSL